MSLILDALRKSERTRQHSLSGRVSTADMPPAPARIPVPWALLIGLLLIANVIALGLIFWRSRVNHAPPESVLAAPVPVAAVATSAPVYRPAIRSLASEAAAVTSNPPVPTAANLAPPNASATESAAAAPIGADVTTTTPVPAQASAAGVIYLNAGNPPPLDTLPLAFQQSLPPLHLDVHGYATNPADRFVVINMQRYRKGDSLKAGPKVIAIVPDGVILEYKAQQFLLPRP